MEAFALQHFCSEVEGKCFSVKGTNQTVQKPQQDKPSQSLLFLRVSIFITLLHRGGIQVIEPEKI